MPVSTVFNPPLSEKKKDMHRFPCRFWREGRRNSQSLRIYTPIVRFPSSPPSIKTDFFDLSLLNQSGKTKSAHLYSQDFLHLYFRGFPFGSAKRTETGFQIKKGNYQPCMGLFSFQERTLCLRILAR